jgi:hypothetical protein
VYRKGKALRQRGLCESRQDEDELLTLAEQRRFYLQIIDKDLQRLPHPDQWNHLNLS